MGNRSSCVASPPPGDFRPFVNFSYNDAMQMLGRPVASIGPNGLPSAPPDDLRLSACEYSGDGNIVNGLQVISQLSNINLQLNGDHTLNVRAAYIGANASESCIFRGGEWLTNGWITFSMSVGGEEFRYRGVFDGKSFIGRWHVIGVENDAGNENEIRRKTGSFHWTLITKGQSPSSSSSPPPYAKEAVQADESYVIVGRPEARSAASPAPLVSSRQSPSAANLGYPGALPPPPPPPPPIPSSSSASSSSASAPCASGVALPVAQPVARAAAPNPAQQNSNNNNASNRSSSLLDMFGTPSVGINFNVPFTRGGLFRPAVGLGGYIPIKLPRS